jgi:REP element-mobilizing transposase RayT
VRKPRLQYPGALYHVIVRGNQRQKTFLNPADYKKYLSLLSQTFDRSDLLIYAYCLMPNHVHLLVEQGGHQTLSKAMQRLQTTYTSYFNRKYKKWGHLFQGRFKAFLVDKDNYLLELVRYIHLNPYRAKLEEKLGLNPWTGHWQYLGKQGTGEAKVALEKVLPMFSGRRKGAVRRYVQFMREGMGAGHQEEIYKGGVWQILGSDEFRYDTLAKFGRQENEKPFRLKLDMMSLWNELIRREGFKKEPEGWKRSRLMAEAGYLAIEYGNKRGREVADFFKVDASAISQARRRLEIKWDKEPVAREKIIQWVKKL